MSMYLQRLAIPSLNGLGRFSFLLFVFGHCLRNFLTTDSSLDLRYVTLPIWHKLSIQKWSYEITWERNIFQQCFHWRAAAALNLFYESKVTFQCVNIKPTQSASECVNPCHLAYQILARNISRDKTKLQICVPWQYIYAHLARLIQYICNRPGWWNLELKTLPPLSHRLLPSLSWLMARSAKLSRQ